MENDLEAVAFGAPMLTARERDCLQLLASGLLASEVRAELGISQSTLEAHLASARRKLDARTTLQAVLTFRADINGKHGTPTVPALGSQPGDLAENQIGLVDALAHCNSFNSAFKALQNYLANFGSFTVNFGVIADVAGVIDQSGVSFWSAASDELTSLYNANGTAKSDPVAQHIVSSVKAHVFDVESALPVIKSAIGQIPGVIEYLMDHGQGGSVCIPARDPLTGAAYGMNIPLTTKQRREISHAASTYTSELRQSLILFWHELQAKRLIATKPGLTLREQEALQFVARGFAVAEIAERIDVSKRAVEQVLSASREKLGARNSAQAIYRAMVYRALG
jgi:DNA-binding CsgD family transcriptional regulator